MAVTLYGAHGEYETGATVRGIYVADTEAELPAAALSGSVGVALDTDRILYHDGTAWISTTYIRGDFRFESDITPAISTTVNDWNPTGLSTASIIRANPTGGANRTITGLAGGADGRIIYIVNIDTTLNVTLSHQSTSSSAANRFLFAEGRSYELTPGTAIALIYDSTSSRWRNFSGIDRIGVANTDEITGSLGDLCASPRNMTTTGRGVKWMKSVCRLTDDVTIANSTTLENLPSLDFDVAANEIWFVQGYIFLNGANATMDAKFGWSVPTGTTIKWGSHGNGTSANAWGRVAGSGTPEPMLTESGVQVQGTGAGVDIGFSFAGLVTVSTTAGTVNFKAAQNTSDAGNLVIQKGSILLIQKMA